MATNPRMNATKNKLEAKASAAKNKSKSKSKGESKGESKPKPKFEYKTIEMPSPKIELEKDELDDIEFKPQMKGSPNHMSDSSYDMNKAYDKNLSGTARLHYLENSMHDKKGKYDNVALPMKKETPMYMSNELKYGGPVIDQMKTLSQEAAGKVLRHSKSKM